MRNGPYELIIPPADYPGKRYRGRYSYEHRVNWWRETGLNPDDFPECVVHHKNDSKRDNDPSNLSLMDAVDHVVHHVRERTVPAAPKRFVCEYCRGSFERFIRGRKVQRFCSRQCSGRFYGPMSRGGKKLEECFSVAQLAERRAVNA